MPTIMVIDDQAMVRSVLSLMLEARGFGVSTAHDGAMALAEQAVRPADAFLVDVDMPGKTGVEVCRELRAWCERNGRPFRAWLMTGVIGRDLEAAAASVGARGVLAKPFTSAELFKHVSELFTGARSKSAA